MLESFKTSMPITIIGALMTIGPAKTVRLRVNLGTQRERPMWETFTITKKEGADGPSYALSCVSERPPAYWQDVSGAFDDPINDMCAGNADLWVETKRRTKRGAYGEVTRPMRTLSASKMRATWRNWCTWSRSGTLSRLKCAVGPSGLL